MEINQAWIDEQRAVCEKVTPATDGDLRISEDDQILVLVSQHGECRCWRSIFGFRNRDDAEFVINAYINYPAALDEIERLAADNQKLREAHELAQSGYGTYAHTGNENAMQREAEKDAEIARLTAERDAVPEIDLRLIQRGYMGVCMTDEEDGIQIRRVSHKHPQGRGFLDDDEAVKDVAIIRFSEALQVMAVVDRLTMLAETMAEKVRQCAENAPSGTESEDTHVEKN